MGSNVVRRLVAEGVEVVVLDLPDLIEASGDVGAELVAADVGHPGSVEAAVAAARPSAIVHLAYLIGRASQTDIERSLTVNCIGTSRVFEAALAHDVGRVVWLSSSAVYGAPEPYGDEPIGEEDVRGESRLVYGACKRLNEQLAAIYTRERGLDQIAFRLALGYGPPGRDSGFSAHVSNLFEGAIRGAETRVAFPDAVQSWVYVDDVVEAIHLGLRATGFEHRVFNLSSDEIYTPAEVGEILAERYPDSRVEFAYEGRAEWPARLDYSRARAELGYSPAVDIREGISRYAASLGAGSR
jgi:nucleoside-diphosphate-sugar epimerase